jgi:chromosomal replication initiator protein
MSTTGSEKPVLTVWDEAMALLKERAPKDVFETWFKDITIGNINETDATVNVPNKFFRDWIREHYQGLLEGVLGAAMGRSEVRVNYVLSEVESAAKTVLAREPERPTQAAVAKGKRAAHLDGRYTFSTFVAASNNQLARAASLKVAESPGISYNPLLIYGGVGLGKTHLMHAIGNLVRADLRIAYVTSEQFTNEVINGIRYDKMIDVRRRYRNIDMLLIDDIQFIAGKQATQEEFFHTFNSL